MQEYMPLVKNVALAFLAAFVASFAAFLQFTTSTDLPALKAAGLAALWAGVRAGVSLVKIYVSGPFAVDTEAGTPVAE